MNLTKVKCCDNCINLEKFRFEGSNIIRCGCGAKLDMNDFLKQHGQATALKCEWYRFGHNSKHYIIPQNRALDFMLAGHCEFVLHSTKTNEDFQFELNKPKKHSSRDIYYVEEIKGILKNYAGYITLDDRTGLYDFECGARGTLEPGSIEIRSLLFVLNKLLKNQPVMNLEVYHVDKCGHCSKALNDKEELESGFCNSCLKARQLRNPKYTSEFVDKCMSK